MTSETEALIPIKLFYCYARKDQDLRDQLAAHLEVLYRSGLIGGRSLAGDVISEKLEAADVILLLVSPAFLNSEDCCAQMGIALERRKLPRISLSLILEFFCAIISVHAEILKLKPSRRRSECLL